MTEPKTVAPVRASTILDDGYAARKAGKSLAENPYRRATQRAAYEAWRKGWRWPAKQVIR